MTSYKPEPPAEPVHVPARPLPSTPKLSYEIGDTAWIHAGLHDADGNKMLSEGTVVYWVDLPDLAQRLYLVRVNNPEFTNIMTRDATVMAPSPEIGFPFTSTRHDDTATRPDGGARDWRQS